MGYRISGFSPESPWKLYQTAGLLAQPDPGGLPIQPRVDSGMDFQVLLSRVWRENGFYSYGDSAGISPDFPFNGPPSEGTNRMSGEGGKKKEN